IGDLPTAAANDVHGAGSQNPRPRGTRRRAHWQVTVTGKLKACPHEEKNRAGWAFSFAGELGLGHRFVEQLARKVRSLILLVKETGKQDGNRRSTSVVSRVSDQILRAKDSRYRKLVIILVIIPG